jgi:hypothetical protein
VTTHNMHLHCTGSGISAYLSTLPGSALRYLDEPVDRNTDLIVLAEPMVNWEQKLQTHLGLTDVEVHDIKDSLPSKPLLQRSVDRLVLRGAPPLLKPEDTRARISWSPVCMVH